MRAKNAVKAEFDFFEFELEKDHGTTGNLDVLVKRADWEKWRRVHSKKRGEGFVTDENAGIMRERIRRVMDKE